MAKIIIGVVSLVIGIGLGYFYAEHQALTKEEVRQYFYAQSDVFGTPSCKGLDIDRFTALCTSGSSWVEPIDEAAYNEAK